MPLIGPICRSWLIALGITLCLGTVGPLRAIPDAAAQQRPDCENFLDNEDSQVALDADPSDPFVLDEQGEGDGEACEQPEGAFGTPPLVNCDDLQGHPDIARALYDHSLRKYGDDRYALAACIEQESTAADPPPGNGSNGGGNGSGDGKNGGGQENDPEVLDGVPPDTSGSSGAVGTVAIGPGETLETRLEARFAALEAQFAEFEVRAANGFGMFPESADEATAGGQVTTVGVSNPQQPTAIAQRARGNTENPIIRAQTAKDGNGERDKERKGKRKGKQRNRR